jgi:VWFA-related protein
MPKAHLEYECNSVLQERIVISYFRFYLIAALALTLNAVVAIAAHFSLQSSTPSSRAVTLNVMVMDKQNLPVADLKREDFQLHDDQTIVPISMFSDEHLPMNYVLALDISRSVKSRFKQLVLTAKTIIRNNQSSDETFLIIFRDESEAVLPHFTADKAMLIGHLDSVSQWVGGQSAILDAAYLSVLKQSQEWGLAESG